MAQAAIPLAVAGIGALGAASAGKGGAAGKLPSFYGRTAGPIATDIRRAISLGQGNFDFNFDQSGNLLDTRYPFPKDRPISENEKALFESQHFFSNLYNNPDINKSFNTFRQRLDVNPESGLVSDPIFKIVRERGAAQAIESGARLGGIRDSGTGRGVADFLTTAEAQQRTYEDERASNAAQSLFNMSFQRGQAGFIPTQTYASVLGALGGGANYGPTPTFSNAKGQAGEITGAGLSAYMNRPQTAAPAAAPAP